MHMNQTTSVEKETHLKVSETVGDVGAIGGSTLDGSDTSTLVKLDLPNTSQSRQQVADKFASVEIPHLQVSIRS